jgi:hypothetical protein
MANNGISEKDAFRIVGKVLLREGNFRMSFDFLERAGIQKERVAMAVSRAAGLAGKFHVALDYARNGNPSNVRLGRLMLNSMRYQEGVKKLVEAGMDSKKAYALAAATAFRKKFYGHSVELFEAAGLDETARRVCRILARQCWKESATSNDRMHRAALYNAAADWEIKSGAPANDAHIKAAQKYESDGMMRNAAIYFLKGEDFHNAARLFFLAGDAECTVISLVSSGMKIKAACRRTAEQFESIGRPEKAAKYFELAWDFDKAASIYKAEKMHNELATLETRKRNKSWVYKNAYRRLILKEKHMVPA